MSTPPGRPTPVRRPLPALVFLLALTLLAALVWWRVLARGDGHAVAEPTCTPTTTAAAPPKQLPEQAAITVQVLNSTERSGIATKAQAELVRDGFQAPAEAANDSKAYPGYRGTVAGVAEIRSGPAGARAAQVVQYYFPGSTIVATHEKDATVLVSLGAKYKGVASTRHVTARLKAAGISLVRVSGAAATEPSASNCATATPQN